MPAEICLQSSCSPLRTCAKMTMGAYVVKLMPKEVDTRAFSSSHIRFAKYLLISTKIPNAYAI